MRYFTGCFYNGIRTWDRNSWSSCLSLNTAQTAYRTAGDVQSTSLWVIDSNIVCSRNYSIGIDVDSGTGVPRITITRNSRYCTGYIDLAVNINGFSGFWAEYSYAVALITCDSNTAANVETCSSLNISSIISIFAVTNTDNRAACINVACAWDRAVTCKCQCTWLYMESAIICCSDIISIQIDSGISSDFKSFCQSNVAIELDRTTVIYGIN